MSDLITVNFRLSISYNPLITAAPKIIIVTSIPFQNKLHKLKATYQLIVDGGIVEEVITLAISPNAYVGPSIGIPIVQRVQRRTIICSQA
jgi:hypothetical protein